VSQLIVNELSLLVGGEAGAGITRSGFLFAKTCLRGGLYVFGANDYQSLIRGGHNFYTVRAGSEQVYSQADTVDLLLALNKETILFHKDELVSGAGIIYDGDQVELTGEELGRDDIKLCHVPLRNIVKELEGPQIMENTVALGAAIALQLHKRTLREQFRIQTKENRLSRQKKNLPHRKRGNRLRSNKCRLQTLRRLPHDASHLYTALLGAPRQRIQDDCNPN
jgi:2-oxoglutarate ferredoxin oxidoreductase subunit alpha